MVPIVSFIGWHNSGKTTISSQVVTNLKTKGYRVAVIKSTKHSGIEFDRPNSDTDTYRKAGADAVSLIAPDKLILYCQRPELDFIALIQLLFNDYDIVICEGFKNERKIPKIEVNRGGTDFLRDQVYNVIATVSDQQLTGDNLFRFDDSKKIADFIIKRFIEEKKGFDDKALLLVNGKKIPMKGFVQDALAGTIHGFVKTLKKTENIKDIDIKISLNI